MYSPRTESRKIRRPFLKIAIGMETRTAIHLLRRDFKNSCASTIVVTTRIVLERMPLHSAATSISILENENTRPSRTTGTRNSRNSRYETSAERHCSSVISQEIARSGGGTARKENSNGKRKRANAVRP